MNEDTVRFCPECGHIGEVEKGKIDCCPDGIRAGHMALRTAKACKQLFDNYLMAAFRANPPITVKFPAPSMDDVVVVRRRRGK